MGDTAEQRGFQFTIRGVMLAIAAVAGVLALWRLDPVAGGLGVCGASLIAGFFRDRAKGRMGILGAVLGGGLGAATTGAIWVVSARLPGPSSDPLDLPSLIAATFLAGGYGFLVGVMIGFVVGQIMYGAAHFANWPDGNVPLFARNKAPRGRNAPPRIDPTPGTHNEVARSTEQRGFQFSIRSVMAGTAAVAMLATLAKWNLSLALLGTFVAVMVAGFCWHRAWGRTGILGAGLGGGLIAVAVALLGGAVATLGGPFSWPDLIWAFCVLTVCSFVGGGVIGMIFGAILYVIVESVSEPKSDARGPARIPRAQVPNYSTRWPDSW